MDLHSLTAHELLDLLREKKTTVGDIIASTAKRIHAVEDKVHAYVRINDAPAVEEYTVSAMPLPIGIKDNLCINGTEVTCASRILEGFVPPYDATVIAKLKERRAVLIGQTNMDEFAFGSSTENSCRGATKNPWDLDCVPGGSSGGSAAAVAAGEAVWALGSDTGGSIRQPASFCGVVGVKPTYGRVSRYGLIAFASSLDQIGPITKDVTDAAILMNIICGFDENDSTSVNEHVPDYTHGLTPSARGLKIGIPKEYFIEGLDPEVRAAVDEAKAVLQKQGAEFVDVSLPHTEYCVATYYIVATAEASSNLARYDGVRYGARRRPDTVRKNAIVDMYEETRARGFGDESKRRIMLGTYSLSSGYYDAYYLRGQKVRTLIRQDFTKVFKHCDAIMAPTAPTTAFRIGEKAADPLAMYLSDIYTISANLAGIPAMSLPCGMSKAGLPIGLQIMSAPFAENVMLRTAFAYEQATPWHKMRAEIT